MTQFSDDLYLGAAPSGLVQGVGTGSIVGGTGWGPMGRTYVYDIVPLALQAANLVASTSPSGAGALTVFAGTGVTAVTLSDGTTGYQLDCRRNVRATSSGNDSGLTLTVTGYAYNGQGLVACTATFACANAGIASSTKAFDVITGITISGATAGTITVGTGDVFGLPVAVTSANYVLRPAWAGALAADAGTFVAADATTATATTGDTRGTYLPSSASNGSRRLTIAIAMTSSQVGLAATYVGLYGVAQA